MLTIDIDTFLSEFNEVEPPTLLGEVHSHYEFVCFAECPDCGKFLILDDEFLSVIKFDDTNFLGTTICLYCERPVVGDIDKDLVKEVQDKGVKVLEW